MEFTKLTNGEKSRTYHFGNGQSFKVENVDGLCVRPSGSHRLETIDGRKFIIPSGWIALEVEAKEWSV